MPPWATGRLANEKPDDPATIDYMTAVSRKMQLKIRQTHDKVYQVGQSRDVVGYAAGGTTEDYAYDSDTGLGNPSHLFKSSNHQIHFSGVNLAWVFELRDTGNYGFLLPPNQILPTAQEIINSFMALGDELRNPTGP